MKRAIIGCGYVGKACAKKWKADGHEITVTTRSPNGVAELKAFADHVIVINSHSNALETALQDQDTVLICVAPDSQSDYEKTYLETAKIICKYLPHTTLKQIIYTSSTSVYGDSNGDWVNEDFELTTDSPHLKILLNTENEYLSKTSDCRVCIFRLGEIVGPGRNILDRLRKMDNLTLPGTGRTFTNIIHLEDIVSSVEFAILNQLEGIYNLVNDLHIPRSELYTHLCQKYDLPPVIWDSSKQSFHQGNKRVSNQKIKSIGFTFSKPNTYDTLEFDKSLTTNSH